MMYVCLCVCACVFAIAAGTRWGGLRALSAEDGLAQASNTNTYVRIGDGVLLLIYVVDGVSLA